MCIMDTQGERLKWARLAAGFQSAAEFARQCDIPEPTYRAHESDGRKLSEPSARAYSKFLNVRWAWLITGEGDPAIPDSSDFWGVSEEEISARREARQSAQSGSPVGVSVQGIAALPRDVRVLGTGIGGNDGDFFLSGQTIDYVRRPPSVSDQEAVFAIYLIGESMYPRYEDGDLVYVNTKIPAAIGRDVLVELHGDGETSEPRAAFVRRLVKRTAEKIILQQFNPPRSDIEIDAARVKHIYRIIYPVELLGA